MILALVLALPLAAAPAALLPAQVEGPVGLVTPDCQPWIWPLSGPVHDPRVLLQTHGQYQSSGRVHRGIDIQASPFETVRAVTDGVVVSVRYQGPGNWSNFVVVAPDASSDWGVIYLHLASVYADPGDKVLKGQLLGRVAEKQGYTPEYNHLHLAFVATDALTPCHGSGALDLLGNPLPFLASHLDVIAPEFEVPEYVVSGNGASAVIGNYPCPIVFLEETSFAPIPITDPAEITLPQAKLDLVVRVSDRFGDTSSSGGPFKLAPLRISLTIRYWVAAPWVLDPHFNPWTAKKHMQLVFCNELEFLRPFDNAESAQERLYRSNSTMSSKGDQNAHDFYFDLTNTVEADGVWDTAASGPGFYLIQVTAEDLSGNLTEIARIVRVTG